MDDKFDLKYFNDIQTKEVEWLWYPYIPYGKITIVQGDPGEGKTTVILSLISALSKGECFPFSNQKFYGVSIYQNAEDDNADTIKPRLEYHKANCENVCFIEKSDGLLFMDDDSIEKAIIKAKAKLLVLDPIQAYIGDNVDMNRANVIRPRMTKLKETAEKTGCAIVLVGHMNKNPNGKASYRGLGSIDISAAARSVLVVGKMKQTPEIKVLAQSKNNLAPTGKSLSFRIDGGAVRWLSECDLTADEVLSGSNVCELSKIEIAEEFLMDRLSDGMLPSSLLISEAEKLGLSKRTLKTAKSNLPIQSLKKSDGWYWEMIEEQERQG